MWLYEARKMSGYVYTCSECRFRLFLRFLNWFMELFRRCGIYLFSFYSRYDMVITRRWPYTYGYTDLVWNINVHLGPYEFVITVRIIRLKYISCSLISFWFYCTIIDNKWEITTTYILSECVCFALINYFLSTNCSGLFVIIVKYSDIYL